MTIEVYAWTYSENLTNAKRIYCNSFFDWTCPKCESSIRSVFDKVPLISYGNYCHVFYCDECDYESKDKMYELISINKETVTIKPSESHELRVR